MKLTRDRIIDAGMAVFTELGYQGLSMRHVAERLDAHAGSLYYHVRNKNALLALLADRVAGEAYEEAGKELAALPESAGWPERIEVQVSTLRRVLRQHRGGPMLIAGSPNLLSPGGLSLMERLLNTLTAAGVPEEHRPVAADTLLSHVTGFVLQEQADTPEPEPVGDTFADLAARFPMTFRSGASYQPDELFSRSVRLQCAAIATLIP